MGDVHLGQTGESKFGSSHVANCSRTVSPFGFVSLIMANSLALLISSNGLDAASVMASAVKLPEVTTIILSARRSNITP